MATEAEQRAEAMRVLAGDDLTPRLEERVRFLPTPEYAEATVGTDAEYLEGTVHKVSPNGRTVTVWGDDGDLHVFTRRDSALRAPLWIAKGQRRGRYFLLTERERLRDLRAQHKGSVARLARFRKQ